ncbi:MAG: hypothetical protein HY657_19135 [Acidobacteria bacterium]|nr:hypothetical protein [Acidobacteriota bacterium]
MKDSARSGVLQLDLFADVSFRAVRQRVEPTLYGTSWIGRLDGYPTSDAVFVLVDNVVMGHIYAPFGFFRIQRGSDEAYLVQQLDQSAGGPESRDDVVVVPDDGPQGSSRPDVTIRADTGSQIDVMVVYTRAALDGLGGLSQVRAAIDLVVAETNQAFRNTGVNTALRLVHSREVGYSEAGIEVDLSRLRTPDDGHLDDVPQLRDQYKADLVALITKPSREYCGFAYVPRSSGSPSYGYSITTTQCVSNGRTFAHELGHNMGAMHDWYVTASAGAFTYSHGHVSLGGRFLDVMSYYDLCRDRRTTCSQLLQYANPRLRHDGHATGVAIGTSTNCSTGVVPSLECDADLATSLNNMLRVVANYRETTTDRLRSGETLRTDQFLISEETGRYRLVYQGDGNLVLYDDQTRDAPWASNTGGTRPGSVTMQNDGNLVIYDAAGAPLFASNTPGNSGAYLVLQNDGNLVIYRTDGRPIWDRLAGRLRSQSNVSSRH